MRCLLLIALLALVASASAQYVGKATLASRIRPMFQADCNRLMTLLNPKNGILLGPNVVGTSMTCTFGPGFPNGKGAYSVANLSVNFADTDSLIAYSKKLPAVGLYNLFGNNVGCRSEFAYTDVFNAAFGTSLATTPVLACASSGLPVIFSIPLPLALQTPTKTTYSCTYSLIPALQCSPPPAPPPRPPFLPPSPPDGVCPLTVTFTRTKGGVSCAATNVLPYLNNFAAQAGAQLVQPFQCLDTFNGITIILYGSMKNQASTLALYTAFNKSASTADALARQFVSVFNLGCGDGFTSEATSCIRQKGALSAAVNPALFGCAPSPPPHPPPPRPPPPPPKPTSPPPPPRSPSPPAPPPAVTVVFSLKSPTTSKATCVTLNNAITFVLTALGNPPKKQANCQVTAAGDATIRNINIQFLGGVPPALAAVSFTKTNIAVLVQLYGIPCNSQVTTVTTLGDVVILNCGNTPSLCCASR